MKKHIDANYPLYEKVYVYENNEEKSGRLVVSRRHGVWGVKRQPATAR